MGKLLFWAVIIVLLLLAARLVARQQASKASGAPRADSRPPLDGAESMVRCAHCGVHLPRSDALLQDGHTWCSPEHARQGVRQWADH